MRRARQVTELLLLPTIGLGVALALAPDRAELEIHVWLLVALVLALLAFMAGVRAAYPSTPSPFVMSLQQPRAAAPRPAALARLEREVSMAGSTAFDVHFFLRPALIELAGGLLSSRRGIDLEEEPERAQAVLGDDVWELVRPDRPQPLERLGTGIKPDRLERVVSTLEHL
jgi:hypothetical protein